MPGPSRTTARTSSSARSSSRAAWEELLSGLRALAAGEAAPELVSAPRQPLARGKVAFVFPGQGSQWTGMARDLLDRSPLFADEIDRCDAALRPHTGWSVLAVLRGDAGAPSLDRVDVVQPALFAVMVSLAAVWRARGYGRTPSWATARARPPRRAWPERSA